MLEVDAGTCRKKTLEPSFEDVKVMPLRYVALKSIWRNGAYCRTWLPYCSQLNYHVHKKEYFAIGFPNVAGGYEIRNGLFKDVPPKDVSLGRVNHRPTAAMCSRASWTFFLPWYSNGRRIRTASC